MESVGNRLDTGTNQNNITGACIKVTVGSVIITSQKDTIQTLTSAKTLLPDYETVVSRENGLGYARNYGARKANGDLLVFLDDDLTLNPQITSHLNVTCGSFAMAFLGGFPCTRVLAIHREDFWGIGGFDESIRFTGEDRDFYMRAVDAGLIFKQIPMSLVTHTPHTPRYRNIYTAIGCIQENALFALKYWRRNPRKMFRVEIWNRLKHRQARTLLIYFAYILYFIARGRTK